MTEPLVTPPILAPVTTAALGDTSIALGADAGYIDNALPFSHMRLRFDSVFDGNRPDRAEFIYAKCGCFRVAGVDPNAPGPPLLERNIDFQDLRAYVEVASAGRFSAFVEGAYRMLNPDNNANATDFGDMNAGFKVALLSNPDQLVTFQLRTYIPTGDAGRGLGTDHVSVEPSLLFAAKPGERCNVFGQVGAWIPIGGTDFAGDIMLYGVGASYIIYETCALRVAPVAEVLGWTLISGQESNPDTGLAVDVEGATIVNAKVGVRIAFGPRQQFGILGDSDLYLGYGRALTGSVWYEDIYRAEYRIRF